MRPLSSLLLGLLCACSSADPAPEQGPPARADRANPDSGIRVGQLAVDFTLPDESGRRVRLSEHRGRSAVLLAFYPKDFTGGWTAELSEFGDRHATFTAKGVQIYGISTDGVQSHRRFRESLGLPFPLLSDDGARVSRLYDSVLEVVGIALSDRRIVLVDRAGRIVYRDDDFVVGDAPDWSSLVAAVEAL